MKLHKALKLKNSLVGEIAKLKSQIEAKNSYLLGGSRAVAFNVASQYEELLKKTQELINLKIVINEANREIQSKIYLISEYKSLIAFWNGVSVIEGAITTGYAETIKDYGVQVNETERNRIVADFQKKVDAIQEELDLHNYTTEVQWGDEDGGV
jgi:hypothetical protein